jgi:hypothetical protein
MASTELIDELKFYIKDDYSEEYKTQLIIDFLETSKETNSIRLDLLASHLKMRIPLVLKREIMKYIKRKGVYKIDIDDITPSDYRRLGDRIVQNAKLGRDIMVTGANNQTIQINARDIITNFNRNSDTSNQSVLAKLTGLYSMFNNMSVFKPVVMQIAKAGFKYLVPGGSAMVKALDLLNFDRALSYFSNYDAANIVNDGVDADVNEDIDDRLAEEEKYDIVPPIPVESLALKAEQIRKKVPKLIIPSWVNDAQSTVMTELTNATKSVIINGLVNYGLGKLSNKLGNK